MMIIIFGGEFGEKRTNAKTVKTRERTNSTKKMTETKVTVINSGRLDRFERKRYENSANRQDSAEYDLSRGD